MKKYITARTVAYNTDVDKYANGRNGMVNIMKNSYPILEDIITDDDAKIIMKPKSLYKRYRLFINKIISHFEKLSCEINSFPDCPNSFLSIRISMFENNIIYSLSWSFVEDIKKHNHPLTSIVMAVIKTLLTEIHCVDDFHDHWTYDEFEDEDYDPKQFSIIKNEIFNNPEFLSLGQCLNILDDYKPKYPFDKELVSLCIKIIELTRYDVNMDQIDEMCLSFTAGYLAEENNKDIEEVFEYGMPVLPNQIFPVLWGYPDEMYLQYAGELDGEFGSAFYHKNIYITDKDDLQQIEERPIEFVFINEYKLICQEHYDLNSKIISYYNTKDNEK